MPSKKRSLNPEAVKALNKFKIEIAEELGLVDGNKQESDYLKVLEKYKHEIAAELGLDKNINTQGWQSVPSKNCGAVGGRMGGKIGGQMVKKMIRMAEEDMKKS